MSKEDDLLDKLKELRNNLESLQQHGHMFVDAGSDMNWQDVLRKVAGGEMSVAQAGATFGPIEDVLEEPDDVSVSNSEATFMAVGELAAIEQEVAACHKCALAKTRTNTVFGVGDAQARLMFIGEAPGADEDRQGEPFVGRAGKLLTDMIKAMGLGRKDVYIANILKCRPPGNRDPAPDEVATCEPYLKRQIAVIKPEVICALGAVAAKTLLKTKKPISRLRGEFHSYEGTALLPTFHPAYLLRNPAAKKDAWDDLRMVMSRLGLEDPREAGT